MTFRADFFGLGLAALLVLPTSAHAFEVCMEGGAWLAYYAGEVQKENWPRVLELTARLPGQDDAATLKVLQKAQARGQLDPGALATLTIEGDCDSTDPRMARAAQAHGLSPETIVGYRLGRAYVALTIVGDPDWFNLVAVNLDGL